LIVVKPLREGFLVGNRDVRPRIRWGFLYEGKPSRKRYQPALNGHLMAALQLLLICPLDGRVPPMTKTTPPNPDFTLTHPGFSHIETWVFDLDNTLYPPKCDLFAQVDVRMRDFISDYLKIDPVEARRLQKLYYVEHGTTLNGLMRVHDLKPAAFLDYVHQIDVSHMPPANDLNTALSRLPGRKVIFTNGTTAHAENVTNQLGITHHFSAVYDIVSVDYMPKPNRASYDRFLADSGIDPTRASMFEDIARNLVAPHDLGMTTVWVRPGEPGPERHQQMAHEGAEGPHVHHVTDDLATFLHSL